MIKSPIPIYRAEAEAGLTDVITANNSLAYISPVLEVQSELQKTIGWLTPEVLQKKIEEYKATAQATNFDLYPIYTIMVSTGWNKNDDIFDSKEVWIARLTPEDKPFNIGHVPSKIIGHITGNVLVDDTLQIIPDSSTFEELPSKFHLLTSAVIYRHLNSRDETLEQETADIIAGIKNGDWYVSMEALFSNFDYGLTTASGEQKVIARCEQTAFLTKHLRTYGGDGLYDGGRLGRVLRNITFSGKGLVRNPANPESIILNDAKQFVGVFANLRTEATTETGEKDMPDTNSAEQIKALQIELAEAKKQIDELKAQQTQAAVAEKEAKIVELTQTVEATNKSIDELTKSKTEAEAAKVAAETKLTEITAKLTEAEDKLAKAAADARVNNRITTLVDKGVDKADAEKIVAEFDSLDDDKFGKIVDMQVNLVEAKKAKKEEKKEEKKETCAKCGKAVAECDGKCGDADAAGEAAAASANVENAELETEPNLAVADENKNAELTASLASYFEQQLSAARK